jgi:hypothetical protein
MRDLCRLIWWVLVGLFRSRAARRGPREAHSAQTNRWANICERLTAALRGWPTSEIEREVRLSERQRVAFYELVTIC